MATKKKPSNEKEAAVIKAKNTATVEKVKSFTTKTTAEKITALTLDIGSQLASVSQQATEGLKELQTINEAIELAKEEFGKIQDITLLTRNQDEIVAAFNAKRDEFEISLKAFEAEFERKKEEVQAQHDFFVADLALARSRGETEYQFKWNETTRSLKAEFDEQMRTARAQARDQEEQLKKNWAEREETLKKQELEVVELRKQVAEFPTKLEAEVKKAEAIVGNSVKRDYTHQMELLKKDAETSAKIAASTIASQNDTINKLSDQLAQAFARIAESEKKVQSIAEKALDAASSQKALTDLQQFQTATQGNGSRKTS